MGGMLADLPNYYSTDLAKKLSKDMDLVISPATIKHIAKGLGVKLKAAHGTGDTSKSTTLQRVAKLESKLELEFAALEARMEKLEGRYAKLCADLGVDPD